jgi:cobalt-zinc-cadmium efflux system outer membrane protein
MKQNILQLILCLTITGIPSLRAEKPSLVTDQMTPEVLVRQALEKNPELNFYRSEIAAARGGLKTAMSFANPELSTQAGYKNARDNSGATLGEGAAWSLSANQTFEYPGRIALRKAIANRDIQLAELGYDQFRLALAVHVRTLIYNIFVARETLTAVQEVALRFEALSEVAKQRDPAGLIPLLEARIIEANTLVLDRKSNKASIAAQTAVLELNYLCGRQPNASLQLGRADLIFREARPLDGLLNVARTKAFDLRVRQAELAQQGFKVSLAKSERYSAIAVGPFVSQERAAETETIAGVGVSVALPLWNRNAGNIDTTKARQEQARASLLSKQLEIERKVIEAALTYETKLHEMAKWRPEIMQNLRDAAELADRHYRLGAVPISIYVELQKQYLEAVESSLDTKKEALEAAQNLELTTGLTPPLASIAMEEKR